MDCDQNKGGRSHQSPQFDSKYFKKEVTELAADQRSRITGSLNWCKRSWLCSKDSLLPLAFPNRRGMATATRGSCFCNVSSAWHGWQIERGLKQTSFWALRWSSFSAMTAFLCHQLIKGGLPLKMRKSSLNVTRGSWWDTGREECGPLI